MGAAVWRLRHAPDGDAADEAARLTRLADHVKCHRFRRRLELALALAGLESMVVASLNENHRWVQLQAAAAAAAAAAAGGAPAAGGGGGEGPAAAHGCCEDPGENAGMAPDARTGAPYAHELLRVVVPRAAVEGPGAMGLTLVAGDCVVVSRSRHGAGGGGGGGTTMSVRRGARVIAVARDGLAAAAGALRVHDTVLECNGVPIGGMAVHRAAEMIGEARRRGGACARGGLASGLTPPPPSRPVRRQTSSCSWRAAAR